MAGSPVPGSPEPPHHVAILKVTRTEDAEGIHRPGWRRGAVLRRCNFQRTCDWTRVVTTVGLPGFHFHDLRHSGNTLASRTGASLADEAPARDIS